MAAIHLTISVRDANNTYTARAIKSINASTCGLSGRRATATSGPENAIEALLRHATPPLQLHDVLSIDQGRHPDPALFHITAVILP